MSSECTPRAGKTAAVVLVAFSALGAYRADLDDYYFDATSSAQSSKRVETASADTKNPENSMVAMDDSR